MGLEQIVKSFEANVRREMEQYRTLANSTQTRLVWFVGIAGYALLNGKSLWESIAGRQLYGYEIFIVSTPWLITALFAISTHFVIDRAEINHNKFYNNKLAEI